VWVTLASQLAAAPPSDRLLNQGWQFRRVGQADWHTASVPGAVQTDLLANGLIPDPFYGTNEAGLQWIGLANWEYRTTFNLDAHDVARRHLDLVFGGLDTFADVFVNGHAALHADNMFRTWRIPAKSLLKEGANELRVVLHSPVMTMLPIVEALPYKLPTVVQVQRVSERGIATDPYTRKAGYQYGWNWGPRLVTLGIWRPIRLEAWDDLRIENLHIRPHKVTPEAADVSADLTIEADHALTAEVTVTGAATATVSLDAGANHISLPFRIRSPKLWYPLGYGDQNLTTFRATIRTGDRTAAEATVRTGLRSVELRRRPDQWGTSFEFVVDGVPVFAKGANVIPLDSFPTRVTPEMHRRLLVAARDAHMNMLRVWGGGYYESDDFYDLCDELGILVWQDFMFGGEMVPGDAAFQENVRQEAIDQVRRLRDHPSVVLWCGNNELETGWHHWGDRQTFKASLTPGQREAVWQSYLLLFNDVLKSVVTEHAGAVPYWPSSPSANYEQEPDNQTNGDMHYWRVWYGSLPIAASTAVTPRFMSEYGFESFPDLATVAAFARPQDYAIDSPVMDAHQKDPGGSQRMLANIERDYGTPKDFASFVYLSQVQQAEAISTAAEHLRRSRPRTMGSLFWQLNDCWPAPSKSSLDYYGRWKALHYAAHRFYADLLISPYRHDALIDVYLVSDKLGPVAASVRTRLLTFDGKTLSDTTADVTVPPAASTRIATLDQKRLLNGADPLASFAVFDLLVGGKVVSRNLVYFDAVRNLRLPAAKIECTVKAGKATLVSPTLARSVYVSAAASDNYFDLIPGEPVTIELPASADAVRVISLTDALSPH
jgi:beta-mannosidase